MCIFNAWKYWCGLFFVCIAHQIKIIDETISCCKLKAQTQTDNHGIHKRATKNTESRLHIDKEPFKGWWRASLGGRYEQVMAAPFRRRHKNTAALAFMTQFTHILSLMRTPLRLNKWRNFHRKTDGARDEWCMETKAVDKSAIVFIQCNNKGLSIRWHEVSIFHLWVVITLK